MGDVEPQSARLSDPPDRQAERLKACDAALALGSRQRDKCVALLLSLARDGDPVVRKRAVECMMEVGGQELVAALVELLKDANASVRATAAMALGVVHDRCAIPALKHALRGDIEPQVRLSAARALGRLSDRSGLPLVMELLNSRDVHLQVQAVVALSDIVGHRFGANQEGVQAARRYVQTYGAALQHN